MKTKSLKKSIKSVINIQRKKKLITTNAKTITTIPVVNSLNDSPNNKTVKWRGKVWRVATKYAPSIPKYATDSSSKLNLSVFDKVFTNPDNPTELTYHKHTTNVGVTKRKLARPFKEKKDIEKKEKVKTETKTMSSVPGKRGRKPTNIVIIWPKKNFTIQDAADLNKCEKYTIVNSMNKLIKEKKMKFEIVKTIPQPSGRGRPTNLFKGVKS